MKRLLLITTCLLTVSPALAQQATMQSPAYTECTKLSSSKPDQALVKADAWLKMDNGIAAQHCRAMALYGLQRFAEAGDALTAIRVEVPPSNISLRSYLARQGSRAYLNATLPDKSLALLSEQLTDLNASRGDNASAAKLTTEILLDRARLNVTYGKLGEASIDLDRAVSLTPTNEDVLLERAGVFEKLGDVPLARADIDSVLAINSGNASARKTRARLNGEAAVNAQAISVPSTIVATPEAPSAQFMANDPNAAPVIPVTSGAMAPAQPATYSPFAEPVSKPVQATRKPKKKLVKKSAPIKSAATVENTAPTEGTAPLDPPATDANAPALPVPAPSPTPASIQGQPKLPLMPGTTPTGTKTVNAVDPRAP